MLAFLLALTTAVGDSVYRGAAGELRVQPPRFEQADIRVDGRLDEPIWQSAAMLTDFTLYEPVEAERAQDATDVLVFYTADAIYFGIRARDGAPDRIRATLAERDQAAFTDDWVRIMLDTFDDERSAYCFYVNPYGIQTDGLWVEGGNSGGGPVPIDFNQDYIWDSEGRIEGDGWTAEIRIPYVSLRFRETAVQAWGINVARETRRNGYKMSWAPLTRNVTSTLAQGGRLEGLTGLQPRRLVELNPVLTGRRTGELREAGFEMDAFEPDVGLNARVGITQNLVADAAINPDFSQVEADADQITLNERFAIFLSEKRPFFLEGADIFRTPQQLVYTRSIIDPVAGAKVTGKVGALNVGYLGALDEAPRNDPTVGERALFNLLRLRTDVGTGSTFGALYTDRTLMHGRGFNRVASADARILFADRYTLVTQLAHAWTRAPDSDEIRTAPLLHASLRRTGRTFGMEITAEDIPPEFEAGSGFLRRIGDARLLTSGQLSFFGRAGAFLERFDVGLMFEGFYAHDELRAGAPPFESEIEITPGFDFRGANTLRFILRRGYFRFDPARFADLLIDVPGAPIPLPPPASIDNMLAVAIFPNFRPADRVQLEGRIYLREVPVYQEGVRGFEVQIAPTLKLWPTDGWYVESSFTRSELDRSRDGSRFSTQNLTRLETQYQFTKALFARAIVQFNLQRRDALRDAQGRPLLSSGPSPTGAFERGDFGANFLLSYEPSPGTLMYLGWARQMSGPETWRLNRLERTAEGLFIKVSYLHRL